ncbi:MAG: fumarylacetoacetate hydrolase family protein [Acidaminococcaceae bacterium]|nr:fumarylacetoacetate hydrolase family protein [Acidaminococcaceae bacterium]
MNFQLNNQIRLGVKVKNGIMDIAQVSDAYSLGVPKTIEQIIAAGKSVTEKLQKYAESTSFLIDEDNIVYAPCVTNPEKIICIGLNYLDHANESKMEIPLSPVVFSKFSNALAGNKQEILLPINAKQFDYEAELVIVIGKTAESVSRENAMSYIFGYTIGNDLSARDLQFRTGQWLLGKTCNGFAPIGPYLVTADEVNPSDLEISCRVNGELRQQGNTKNMIFDCAYIVSYLSHHMTLKPGDIIFTGTPAGVILGYPEGKRVWLKSGDEVSVSIEKIGTLINKLK